MNNKKTNAFKGSNIESLFKNSLSHQPKVVNKIKQALDIDMQGEVAKSYKTGTDKGKADVIIRFTTGETISANIKSYRVGFNQATRMAPHTFIDRFNIPADIAKILTDSIIRKARNSHIEPFITEQDKPNIIRHFDTIAYDIIKHSICGEEMPELFVLWNENQRNMSIYLMHALLDTMRACISVEITPRGVIRLNPYFTIQRKGGNGIRDKHKKTDINHGGNNIQVKIKTSSLRNDYEPLCKYFI